jgi:hypothetical protein
MQNIECRLSFQCYCNTRIRVHGFASLSILLPMSHSLLLAHSAGTIPNLHYHRPAITAMIPLQEGFLEGKNLYHY